MLITRLRISLRKAANASFSQVCRPPNQSILTDHDCSRLSRRLLEEIRFKLSTRQIYTSSCIFSHVSGPSGFGHSLEMSRKGVDSQMNLALGSSILFSNLLAAFDFLNATTTSRNTTMV